METGWLVGVPHPRMRRMCLRHAGLQDVFDLRRCEYDESCPVAQMGRRKRLLLR